MLLVAAQFALIGLIACKAGPFFLALQASALATNGRDAWIRPPMYSAILLMGLAGIYGDDIPGRTLVGTAFFALLGVLWVKAGIEDASDGGQPPRLCGRHQGQQQVLSLAEVAAGEGTESWTSGRTGS